VHAWGISGWAGDGGNGARSKGPWRRAGRRRKHACEGHMDRFVVEASSRGMIHDLDRIPRATSIRALFRWVNWGRKTLYQNPCSILFVFDKNYPNFD
jgi:hypothetical protein